MKKTHTKSQEEVLLSDWLSGRRDASQGYIHKNTGKGIGSTVGRGEAYSHQLTGDLEDLHPLELLRKARKTAEYLANTISPVPVKVVLGNSTGSYNTGGTDITLESDHFDRTDITAGEKTDILLGYAVHEAAHSLHTDFEENAKRLTGSDHPDLRKTLANILEDERIEYLVGDSFPGYINYVGEVKKHLWERLLNEKKGEKEPEHAVAKVINSLLGAVRFPAMLDAAAVSEHFDELDAIRKVLTPYPMTTDELWNAVDGIMDVIRDLVKKEMEEEQKKQQEQQQKSGNGQPSDGQQGGNGGDTGENPSGEDSDADGSTCPSESDIENEIDRQLGSAEAQKAMKQAEDCSGSTHEGGHDSVKLNEDSSQYVNDDRADRCEGENGGSFFVLFPKDNKNAYLRSRAEVQKHIPAASVALTYRSEDSDYCLQGMPSGKLNTNRFASYMAGNERIFTQQGHITCDKAAVCVLIDESGSMQSRLTQTRNAAVLINEAIKRIPKVDYYAYGFTTGRINVYSEGHLTGGFALGNTEADTGTPTGDAMRIAAQRIRRHTKSGVLMLVLTDGDSNDNKQVSRQDKLLRKDGIIPIGIGIQTDCVRQSFSDWMEVNDLATFPQQMARLTREHLTKMLVKHDSAD